MNETAIVALIARQKLLIEALDADDATAIADHSAGIDEALVRVRAASGRPSPQARALAEEAIVLADAARVRINVLADMTQRRLARLAVATGKGAATQTYGRDAKLRTL